MPTTPPTTAPTTPPATPPATPPGAGRDPAPVTPARISLRARLTLIYGSLFVVTGTVLVGVTYLLAARAVKARFQLLVATRQADDQIGIASGPAQGALPVPSDGATAAVIVGRRELLDQLLQISILTTVALGAVAVALGYLVAGRTLRPLQTVTATARRLSESTLHERIALTGPQDEIKELADTFDAMLDRLHRAFDSQRRFIANASHELRTPLAINRAVIEVALAKRGAHEETKALAGRLLGTTARNERLIEGLLLLARSERELRDRVPVELRELLAGVIEQFAERAEQADVAIEHALFTGWTAGDPVLLEQCAANLVENAIKYNEAGGRVVMRTGEGHGRAFVQVENTGPPVPPDLVETIFEPFRRLAGDRVGSERGCGLGLSIVRAVCIAHGGMIRTFARPAGGLLITLELPAVAVPRPPALTGHPGRVEHAACGGVACGGVAFGGVAPDGMASGGGALGPPAPRDRR